MFPSTLKVSLLYEAIRYRGPRRGLPEAGGGQRGEPGLRPVPHRRNPRARRERRQGQQEVPHPPQASPARNKVNKGTWPFYFVAFLPLIR